MADEDEGGTFKQEDIDAAVASAVAKANEAATTAEAGLKAKNEELLAESKANKTALKAWEGLEPEKVKGMLAHFDNDQDLKDIADGKHQDVIARRVEKTLAESTAAVEAAQTEATTNKAARETAELKVSELLIDSKIVAAFIAGGGDPGAVEDIKFRAQGHWKVEESELVARDEKGNLITGAEGPQKPAEWIEGLKKNAAHLFKPSKGADSGEGDESGTSNADTIDSLLKSGDREKFRELRRKQLANKPAF